VIVPRTRTLFIVRIELRRVQASRVVRANMLTQMGCATRKKKWGAHIELILLRGLDGTLLWKRSYYFYSFLEFALGHGVFRLGARTLSMNDGDERWAPVVLGGNAVSLGHLRTMRPGTVISSACSITSTCIRSPDDAVSSYCAERIER
jgi:hypothetical protein